MKNAKLKVNRLLDHLEQIPKDRIFLVMTDSVYTFGDVIELCRRFSAEHSYLANSYCAIVSDDRESLALFFPLIDSVCQGVFLQPKDIKETEGDFYTSAGIDYVIRLSSCTLVSISLVSGDKKSFRNEERAYLLATSGTTGSPKLASYTLETLLLTAKKDISRGTDFIWGLAYDINRFAGLQVYLQAIVSGSTLVIPPDPMNMKKVVNLFIKESVNALSGTPSFWQKILMEPTHSAIPFKRITLGGEMSHQRILSALNRKFPSAAISHIYASTEVGVGFAVKDKQEGFPTSYLDGISSLKCHLKVNDGILWIKSPNGCRTFLKGVLDVDADGFINTGDMVKIENDRVLFLGRQSGLINVGGNKVMPEKVESILEMHPSVTMAYVFSKSNPVLGSLVASEVVLSENAKDVPIKELKRELLSFCRKRLDAFEVPALLKVVDSIKTNATGKKVRKR